VVEIDYGFPKMIKYLFSVFVICTIVWYKISNPSKPAPGGFFYLVTVAFIISSLILLISLIFRINNLFYIQRILGVPYFFLPYLLPIFLLYSRFDLEFISYYFKYSFIFIIPAILIQLYVVLTGVSFAHYREQASSIMIFDIGSSFLLITAQFSKRKYIFNIVLLYTVIMIFLFTQYGRRGVLVEYMLLLSVMVIIRLRSRLLFFKDRIKVYFAGLMVIVFLFTFGHIITSSYAFQRGFTRDAFDQSRGNAFKAFFYDFRSTSDWIFGRGLDGTVLRSLVIDVDRTYDLIENGYLSILLKGGLLYSIPFVLILLRASYLGFYRSNNDMVKALASMILIYLIIMFSFNVPNFTTKYVFLWISVSICFTPGIRNLSNEEISKAIDSRFT
jgi:hypothetical protein